MTSSICRSGSSHSSTDKGDHRQSLAVGELTWNATSETFVLNSASQAWLVRPSAGTPRTTLWRWAAVSHGEGLHRCMHQRAFLCA